MRPHGTGHGYGLLDTKTGAGKWVTPEEIGSAIYSPTARGVLGIDLEMYAQKHGFATEQYSGEPGRPEETGRPGRPSDNLRRLRLSLIRVKPLHGCDGIYERRHYSQFRQPPERGSAGQATGKDMEEEPPLDAFVKTVGLILLGLAITGCTMPRIAAFRDPLTPTGAYRPGGLLRAKRGAGRRAEGIQNCREKGARRLSLRGQRLFPARRLRQRREGLPEGDKEDGFAGGAQQPRLALLHERCKARRSRAAGGKGSRALTRIRRL